MCHLFDFFGRECFLRNRPYTEAERGGYRYPNSLSALSQDEIWRGTVSWEHFQYPEPLQPPRCQVLPEASAPSTPRVATWLTRQG